MVNKSALNLPNLRLLRDCGLAQVLCGDATVSVEVVSQKRCDCRRLPLRYLRNLCAKSAKSASSAGLWVGAGSVCKPLTSTIGLIR